MSRCFFVGRLLVQLAWARSGTWRFILKEGNFVHDILAFEIIESADHTVKYVRFVAGPVSLAFAWAK